MTNRIKTLIGVNLLLIVAIGFSFVDFSTANKPENLTFFNIENLGDITQFDIDGHSIQKLEDGRWVMDQNIDLAPQKVGMLFQAVQQTKIIEAKGKSIDAGKEITIYISNIPVITAKIHSESDVASFGEINGQAYAVEVPGQFVNLEEIFSPSKEWRDKTIFRTSWKTLKNFDLQYDRNPGNNVQMKFEGQFYSVKGVSEIDSAAVYQFITSLPKTKGSTFEVRNSFVEDTVSKFKPFCIVKMEDLVPAYDVEVGIYPFQNNVFAYFPNTKEVTEIDTKQIQDVLVSWHFFDANDPRKRK
ncbi:hypothetical protein [Flammeovirga aprica]|uniref:DUF4340 domain-containing protein n=1 Tax=Flammeovirga aprica JL-4 TaxID=694437 RepID=A0A7X9RTI3_9BACT|nr:hypothetical protein [Flammeovirga aprica]NME68535.1 hypothetical protein [Flammeovirga aprica JL-4]